jgi:hypothetical protein
LILLIFFIKTVIFKMSDPMDCRQDRRQDIPDKLKVEIWRRRFGERN